MDEQRSSTEPSIIPDDNIIKLGVIEEHLKSCRLNYAACKLKLGDMKSVILSTTQVLENDKQNIKALFRRGQAYMKLNKLELAKNDFDCLKELLDHDKPEYTQLQTFIKALDDKFKNHSEKEKEMFGGKLL